TAETSGWRVACQATRIPVAMASEKLSAVITRFGRRSFAELNANANRLARLLRNYGLVPGDAVAIVSKNRPEFVETVLATARSGIRITPINFHLTADEIGYIVDDCEAKVFIADATLLEAVLGASKHAPRLKLCLAVGGELTGFDDYADAIGALDGTDLADPVLGNRMLYTSGTTGRPKGVYKEPFPEVVVWRETVSKYRAGEDCQLVTGPAYHAAPLLIDVLGALNSGVGIVMMNGWDAEETLRLIQEHRVTHTHMVPTMFHRLIRLPEEIRNRYDISSLRCVVHGAAPCPVHLKHAMIDWLGPVLWEYYGATEGSGGFFVGSEEWLTKPGTVGKPGPDYDNRILDAAGNELPPGEVGTIYMRAPKQGRFRYFKDENKTTGSYHGDHFTLGDMGYFDKDGYLFLTGRSAELIISGGVNIYPQEVDAELLKHEVVADACTFGVPNEEWGEEVRALVQLQPTVAQSSELTDALMAWCRARLAGYKCPRHIEYRDELPRSAAGKIQRKEIRANYLSSISD
ncbi:MAG: AMP-binding protein, partial [Pseudomonadota bacterium]